jgi:tyrosyl-tRNA synthetase
VNKGGNTRLYPVPGNRTGFFYPQNSCYGLTIYLLGGFEMQIYEELKRRGLIAQVTDEDAIREMVNNGKATFYIGFDCTADSLTAGHFMALTLMKRLQEAGNKPIALIGGGTTMIGDPSGKSDMRKMLTIDDINHNAECFKKQMERFIDFSDGKALLVNNADWLLDLNYIELLREVGACFSVNNMLRAECYKQRMERGLTFLEFNYMIMQSYDFYHMFKEYNCNMEFGGDDQWSNMLGGTELIRRKLGKDAHAMTITLLTDSQGMKMGKTAGNAVWLDANKTSPYDFFQYWRNVGDADVIKCLKMLTFLPIEEIEKMESWEGSELNKAKEILGYELTKLVHGEEEANKALESARAVFSVGSSENMPTTEVSEEDLFNGKIDTIAILVKAGLVATRSEGRRAIEQGGVTINEEKVTDIKLAFTLDEIAAKDFIIKRGKKNFRKIVVK